MMNNELTKEEIAYLDFWLKKEDVLLDVDRLFFSTEDMYALSNFKRGAKNISDNGLGALRDKSEKMFELWKKLLAKQGKDSVQRAKELQDFLNK